MSIPKAIKILLGILGTIILGALGSGLWESIISPGLSWSSSAIASFFSSMSTRYQESVFQLAAEGESEMRIYRLQLLMGLLFFFGIMLLVTKQMWLAVMNKWRISRALTATLIFATLIGFVLRITYLDAARNVRDYSFKSLEILRPHLEEEKYLFLRSEFMQIRNKQQYLAFREKITMYQDSFNVWLPDAPEI